MPLATVVAGRGVERLVPGRPGWEALVGGPATAVNPRGPQGGSAAGGGGGNAAGARPRGNGHHRALRHPRDRDRGVAGHASAPIAALTLESAAVSFWALAAPARTRLAAARSRREARILAGGSGAERGGGVFRAAGLQGLQTEVWWCEMKWVEFCRGGGSTNLSQRGEQVHTGTPSMQRGVPPAARLFRLSGPRDHRHRAASQP